MRDHERTGRWRSPVVLAGERTPYRWLPFLLLLVGISVLVAGLAAVGYVRDRLVGSAGESLAIAAVNIADDLDHVISERAQELRFAARVAALHASDTEQAAAYLRGVKQGSDMYLWLGVTDGDGVVVAATSAVSLGLSVRERSWFQQARGSVDLHIRDAGTSLAFALPLDGAGEPSRGVLAAHLGFGALQRVWMRTVYAMRAQRGGWMGWQLVTAEGEVIQDSLQRHQMTPDALAGLLRRTSSSSGYFKEMDPVRGVPVVTGFARTQGYRDAPALGWTVLASMDENDIVAPIHRIVQRVSVIGFGIVMPVFGLLLWSARRLRQESAEALSAGARATTAEIERADGEAQIRAIVHNASDAILTVDEEGAIESINLAGERLFGYAADELIGLPVSLLAVPHDGEVGEADLAPYFSRVAGTKGAAHEVSGRCKGGTILPLELTVSEVRLGGRSLYTGILRDLTTRKHAETLAREHEANLAYAQRLGSLGEMASGLAHEINQPLTGIASFAAAGIERLRSKTGDSGEIVEILERIGSEAERAGAIIHHQLEFVRKGEPAFEPTSVPAMLQGIDRLLRAEARRHGISLRVNVADADLTIRADPVQIEQVLVNLLQNAIESIRGLGKAGDIWLEARRSSAGMVTIEVRDTGGGLSDDVRERMFTAFFTTKPEGLGMGLAISRSIVEAHGGQLWAAPGSVGGSTLAFTVPIHDEEQGYVD